MSYHHDNVVWQSPDGTWNRGFFQEDYLTCGGHEDECGDETHEWCREFDQSQFMWVSTGHPTQDSSIAAWNGANPGSMTIYAYDPNNPASIEAIEEFEDIAAKKYEQATARRAAGPKGTHWFGTSRADRWGYEGPPKQRTLKALRAERDALIEQKHQYRVQGADNLPDPRIGDLKLLIDERMKSATEQERKDFAAQRVKHRDRLQAILDRALEDERRDRLERSRRGYRPSTFYGYYGGSPARNTERLTKKREAREALEQKIAEVDGVIAREAAQEATKTAPVKKAATKKTAQKTTTKATGSGPGRVPRGVPAGGQFTAAEKRQADVALTPQPAPEPASRPASAPPADDDWGDSPWG